MLKNICLQGMYFKEVTKKQTDTSKLVEKLYNSEDTDEQIEINSVLFHPIFLKTFSDYFKDNKGLNKTIENSALKDLPLEVLKVFKKIVYHQEINEKDLTGEEFIILYNFLDYICAEKEIKELIYYFLKDKQHELKVLEFFIKNEDECNVRICLRTSGYFNLELFKNKKDLLCRCLGAVHDEYYNDINTDGDIYLEAKINYFKENYEKARSLFKKDWEENENVFSLHNLGYMISMGLGGYDNYEEGIDLVKKTRKIIEIKMPKYGEYIGTFLEIQ
jgi:hypothetical protein